MKVIFGNEKSFKQPYLMPPVGNFALEVEPPKAPHWDHCREQFAEKFKDIQGFFYSVHPDTAQDVASFLVKCEEIIGIKEMNKSNEYSTFSRTEKNTILWVSPSLFWLDCTMKRSLLTVFLRCALNYNEKKDNFDDALFADHYRENKYARETKAATMRFLFGFTKWVENLSEKSSYFTAKHGWFEEFHSQDIVNVRKKLTRPEGETIESSVIGIESLWS